MTLIFTLKAHARIVRMGLLKPPFLTPSWTELETIKIS
jgi:hypothetical protein